MRQKALAATFFVALSGILAFPVLAQNRLASYETYIVDSFDNNGAEEWSWIAAGSKNITEGYPRIQYFDGMPSTIRLLQSDPETQYRVMGVEFKFNRQGNNWVDIIPVAANANGESAPYEIPFRGNVSRIDMWVWGSNHLYELEVLVRDMNGTVHVLPMGWLNFEGWRNLSVNVPTSLPQASRYTTRMRNSITLVALRVRTAARERVDDFKIFFDQLRVFTNAHRPPYDGYEFESMSFDSDNSGYSSGNYYGEDNGL